MPVTEIFVIGLVGYRGDGRGYFPYGDDAVGIVVPEVSVLCGLGF